MSVQEAIDFLALVLREAEFGGRPDSLNLLGAAPAHDCPGDGRVGERPCNGNDAGRNAVPRADLLQEIGDAEIAAEQRLLIVLGVAAEVGEWPGGEPPS